MILEALVILVVLFIVIFSVYSTSGCTRLCKEKGYDRGIPSGGCGNLATQCTCYTEGETFDL
jgi:hypothetical protein